MLLIFNILSVSPRLQGADPVGPTVCECLQHHDQRQLSSLPARPEPLLQKCSLKPRRDEPDVPAERLCHDPDPPLDQDGNSSWAPGFHGNHRVADGDRSWFLVLSQHQTGQPSRPTRQVDEAKERLKELTRSSRQTTNTQENRIYTENFETFNAD